MFFRAPPVPIPDLESKGAIFIKGGNIKSKKSKIRKKRQKWRKTFKKLETIFEKGTHFGANIAPNEGLEWTLTTNQRLLLLIKNYQIKIISYVGILWLTYCAH